MLVLSCFLTAALAKHKWRHWDDTSENWGFQHNDTATLDRISTPSNNDKNRFNCNGITSGKASFYDIQSSSQNDGFSEQVSCGSSLPVDGLFVAVSSACFSMNLCHQTITVTYNHNTIQVPILDECASCAMDQIDLTQPAWVLLESDTNIGVLDGVIWS